MARMPQQQVGESSLAARRVPVTVSTERADLAIRMVRFAVSARRVLVRAVTIGGLMVAGWLLAVLFGASSATAEASVEVPAAVTVSPVDGFPTVDATVPHHSVLTNPVLNGSALNNAEAMAGLNVDGLTSQSKPGLPAPSTAGDTLGLNSLMPNGGGGGPFGPTAGDVARFVFNPRLRAQCAPLACVLPPVVRTAADDPSFSPD